MRARSAVLAGTRSLAGARRTPRPPRAVSRPLSSDAAPPAEEGAPTPEPPPPAAAEPSTSTPPLPPPPPKRVAPRITLFPGVSVVPEKDANDPIHALAREILWVPSDPVEVDESTLPPQDIYNEGALLSHLLITLSPRTQRRAAFVSDNSQTLIEPTLGLYCPLEGGEYVIDNTVRALARQIDADVVVLDGAQLAAGEWGIFGKGAECIQFTRNPLHFTDLPSAKAQSSSAAEEDEADEEDGPEELTSLERPFILSTSLSIPALRPQASASRRAQPLSRARLFFDQVISLTRPTADRPAIQVGRPRIIYVRDFALLASQSSAWLPALVEAVRERRRNPSAKPLAPVPHPTTIVFGVTPALVAAESPGAMLLARLSGRTMRLIPRPPQDDAAALCDETPEAEKARERRHRQRLARWEAPEYDVQAHLPSFSLSAQDAPERAPASATRERPAISFVSNLMQQLTSGGSVRPPPEERQTYYRASFLVPRTRSPVLEKESRMTRRRQINELLMRMGIGHIGGSLEKLPHPPPLPAIAAPETPVEDAAQAATPEVTPEATEQSTLLEATAQAVTSEFTLQTLATEDAPPATPADAFVADSAAPTMETLSTSPDSGSVAEVEAVEDKVAEADMVDTWGHRVETWSSVKEVADRALGTVVASQLPKATRTLEPVHVPWHVVRESWAAQRGFRDARRAWIKESGIPGEDADGKEEQPEEDVDEVIERLKHDPSLNNHEQRLLGCIVNPSSMPTTFNQVHLPEHTIDSVRTLVSLPLLHPDAFSSGVLKQHTMTGALLFGPPGTGKTLLVRALARESGARMMIVTPSDVMDMYVGEGEKLVRAVFTMARRLSPCVVFLDEIDALFGARVSGRGTGGTIAHRGVITEFMQEMDGLKTREDSNVIVIGATNRPFDLDDAVLRRLPRRLMVDLPGEREREEILKIMLRDEELESDVDLKALAKRTESFSGSDLKHLCVAAALDAVKETVKLPWITDRKLLPAPSSESDASTVTAAALEAQDEELPQNSSSDATAQPSDTAEPPSADGDEAPKEKEESKPRRLAARHFVKALCEITPSASEAMGTLAELRKWNEEFGENGRAKKRMWGGSFGFVDHAPPPPHETAQQPGPRI
ncbi:AAA-domain-containing protein [Auricularia subglabra TFB-10046 SS5]|nr:AAA-domain-containing protein [Auricularia subglabra TFB-10046 SS5]